MEKERWQEISTLLDKLLTIDEASQLTYLEQHYGHDEELVQEVRDILFSISKSEENNFLESASKDHPELIKDIHDYIPEAPVPKETLIGQTVGAYEIEFMIGKGGMGSVYRARRADGQFEQSVAIKFINQQNITVVSQNRFRQEQKILANLQHSNIAMLFDGGVTDKGFPYLVMEYVEGTRIDHYCSENSLNLENRLELCKKILHTIDYAHSNLVVHRDLKPTNILVTETGEAKILDFGIAKLMNDDTAEPAMQTAPGQRMWTPRYAAPEQVLEKSPMLQTDIYSLGMLMYELLTGASPFDLKEKSIHEVEDTIISERPRLMSETVKKMDADSIQQAFGMKKQTLIKELETDLDAIVDKAIRKEPEHRYSSTTGFLDDINRSQNDLPVAAKRGNFTYRAGKFLRRHKQKITTAAIVLLIIVGTVAYYTTRINQQRNVAEYEAAKAQEISEFLVGIFESANSYEQNGEALGLEASIGSILDHNISRLDEELGDQPELKATLNTTISKIYLRLGDFDRAENLATNAVESLSDLDGESREQLAEGLYELARVNQERGNTALADSLLLQAIGIHERTENGLVDEQALAAVSFYANLQWFNNGRFDIADSLLSGNLDIRYEHFSDNPNSIAVGHNDLAAMNHSRGHFDEAAEHYQKAIEIYTEELGDHPAVAVSMNNYAILLREYRQLDEAEKNQQKALEIHIEKQGEENIDVGLSLGNMGEIMLLKGDLQKADSLTSEAMRILTDIYGDVHPYIARTALTTAKIRAQQQRLEEAESMFENVIESYRQSYPPDHPRQSDPLFAIGKFYLTTDRPQRAEPYLSDALDIRKEGFTLNNWRTAVVMSLYGEALLENGKSSNAEQVLRQSADILVNEFGEDHIYSVEAINRTAEVE